jgi:antitoxin (DNA-binding transcriptional repressor) of toxin-antitoxin stability system
VILTVDGAPVADIVPHDKRRRWLGGDSLRAHLLERAADSALADELDELAGQGLDDL